MKQSQPERKTDKFRELIIHIASKCESDRPFGATKLNKLLFFVDFFSYLKTGSSITGEEYQKLDHGPCPRRLVPVMNELVAEGSVVVKVAEYFGREQKRIVARRQADLSLFTAEEIAFVDGLIEDSMGRTATELSEFSHEFLGWRLARIGETIPYAVSLIGTSTPTEQEVDYGRTLEGMAKECLTR